MKTVVNDATAASAATIVNPCEGVKKSINPELWQACAGPLVNLPPAGIHVVYFPQGHSEQVAASMKKDVNAHIPNLPNLPSKLLCILHNVTLHADPETDEVYAQMTLQPVPSFDKDALLRSDLALKSNKSQPEFFCKTLTASDTSTHGGFSVPRRAAEKIFPPLDFSMQPPAQELVARDLHDNIWSFRHIYRGQPKRHLLTTGWSLFVSGKKLSAGDSVLFIRDEKQQLLLGIRRANRQQNNLSSSVLSSDSMHIGILAAAAHAAANSSPFTVFYNPRASPSEFVIPLAKYYKAVTSYQVSLGMRFRMMFETEESGTRRYMGTVTGISDLDPVRWKSSQWRNLQVGWDESTAGERRTRVSVWEIEPVTAPFFICPPPFFRPKRPRPLGMPDDESSDIESMFKRSMPWLGDDMYMKDSQTLPGLSLVQWMNMQQNPSLANAIQTNFAQPFSGPVLQNLSSSDISRHLSFSAPQIPPQNFSHKPTQQAQLDQLTKMPSTLNQLGSIIQPRQQLGDINQQQRQNLIGQTLSSNQAQAQVLQPRDLVPAQNILQQQQSIQHHLQRNLPQNQNQQQHMMSQNQHLQDQVSQPLQNPDNQIQLHLLQKYHQQQVQDQQRQQLFDISQILSRSMMPNQVMEKQQVSPTSLPQSHIAPQQITKIDSQTNLCFSSSSQQSKLQQQQSGTIPEFPCHFRKSPTPTTNKLPTAGSSVATGAAGGGQSVITDDIPSCSTSPSSNNCSNGNQTIMNGRAQRSTATIEEEIAQSAAMLQCPRALETRSSDIDFVHQKSDPKPMASISKNLNLGSFTPQTDYLDTSSSATSACLSQNDVHLQPNNNHLSSFNPQCMLLRESGQDGEVVADPRNSVPFETSIDGQLGMLMDTDPLLAKGIVGMGKDFSNHIQSGNMLPSYENCKDPQQELSASMVSQSFGVPDMAFNSIDSTMNDSSFLNTGAWAPPQQFQRIRTYTKVYKRGAVGRSIDVTRYSGYDELKQDLARRFGIEGQLEDRHRIGWKLVYVDHENDVLLVGDDPWEEFVNCVRCIKILSPQEVQQMSLDGDFGNSVLPNQACSSSDGGNT